MEGIDFHCVTVGHAIKKTLHSIESESMFVLRYKLLVEKPVEKLPDVIAEVESCLSCGYANVPVRAVICPQCHRRKNAELLTHMDKEKLRSAGLNVESAQRVCCKYAKYMLCGKRLSPSDVAYILWQIEMSRQARQNCRRDGSYIRAARSLNSHFFPHGIHADDERVTSNIQKKNVWVAYDKVFFGPQGAFLCRKNGVVGVAFSTQYVR